MRLAPNGELIAETGFDGGSYQPRYEARTSVYLGDMSKEDIRVKDLVRKRMESAAVQDVQARAAKSAKFRAQIAKQDRINQEIQHRELMGAAKIQHAKAAGYLAALESSSMETINPWVGSPFAGFGNPSTEQRINPDSNQDVQIVDMDIPSVSEYGINNWMEDPSHLENKVADSQAAYTEGKVWMQTMVDYAQSPDRSVVGMPVPAQGILDHQQEIYDVYAAKNQLGSLGDATASPIPPLVIAAGVVAALYFVFRRKHA